MSELLAKCMPLASCTFVVSGLSFLHENMWRIAKEEQDSMPIGFELAFPSLIQTARNLGIDFPYDHPALQSIYSNREIKLKRYEYGVTLWFFFSFKKFAKFCF